MENIIFRICRNEYKKIIENNITDFERIGFLFEILWVFIDDERFHKLYWKLVKYIDTLYPGSDAFYRRIEKVHFEGE